MLFHNLLIKLKPFSKCTSYCTNDNLLKISKRRTFNSRGENQNIFLPLFFCYCTTVHFYTHSEMVGRVREWRPHLSYVERVLDRSQRSFRSFNYYTGPKPSSQLTAAAATWALLVGPKNFSPSKAACLNGPIDKTSQTKPTTPYVSLLLQKVWIRTHQFFKFSCCIFCEYKKGKLFCHFFWW